MQNTFHGIVLHSIPFSDSRLITTCYTLEWGRISIWTTRSKSKKSTNPMAFIRPLTLIEGEISTPEKKTIKQVKGLKVSIIYHTVYDNPIKNSIFLFLAELLTIVIHEEEKNEALFRFIVEQLISIDQSTAQYNTLHLDFMIGLTKHLGFYPHNNYAKNQREFFNLHDGEFASTFTNECLSIALSFNVLKLLNRIEFNSNETIPTHDSVTLLNVFVEFYRIHIAGFYTPKSLAVFKALNQ